MIIGILIRNKIQKVLKSQKNVLKAALARETDSITNCVIYRFFYGKFYFKIVSTKIPQNSKGTLNSFLWD